MVFEVASLGRPWLLFWFSIFCSSNLVSEGQRRQEIDAEFFQEHGYLILPGFADASEVAKIQSSMRDLIESWSPEMRSDGQCPADSDRNATSANCGLTASWSGLRSSKHGHQFLLESATKPSIFLDPEVTSDSSTIKNGTLNIGAVRKVAHGLHLHPGPWRDLVHSPKMRRVVHGLGWKNPVIIQTQYRVAAPKSAGVDRHQDSTSIYTYPPTCLGVWLALEDADEANGCLRIRAGSHRGPLWERLVVQDDVNCTHGGCRDGECEKNCSANFVFEKIIHTERAPNTEFTPIPVSKGDAIVLHGFAEHYSDRGHDASRGRASLQYHFVEKSAQWASDNWLQYPDGLEFEELQSQPSQLVM